MTANEIAAALARPFDADEIKARPGKTSGNRALVIWYVDARLVQERLDEVVGINHWQDSYQPMPDGTVVCRLSLRIEGEWLTKEDVGVPSAQPDAGDKRKAAFSGALKRAAFKWGVGRYLKDLPAVWADYDPQKKQLTKVPAPPATKKANRKAAPAAKPVVEQQPAKQAEKPKNGDAAKPKTGSAALAALAQEIAQTDTYLVGQRLAGRGDVEQFVLMTKGVKTLADLDGEDVIAARNILKAYLRQKFMGGIAVEMKRAGYSWDDAAGLLGAAEGEFSEKAATNAQLKTLFEKLAALPTPEPAAVGA